MASIGVGTGSAGRRSVARAVGLLLAFAVVSLADPAAADDTVSAIEEQIDHAETWYWLGVLDRADHDCFRDGLTHLREAERLLDDAKLPEARRRWLQARIDALRADLEAQRARFEHSLAGYFAVSGLLNKSFLVDSNVGGSFELVAPPHMAGTKHAMRGLIEQILDRRPEVIAPAVVLRSREGVTAIESAARYALSQEARFRVVSAHQQASLGLTDPQWASLRAGTAPPELLGRLERELGAEDVLVVEVRKQDEVNELLHHYVATARLYSGARPDQSTTFDARGIIRDRTGAWPWLLGSQIALLVLAILAWLLLLRSHGASISGWGTALGVPVVAYGVGRMLPWLLAAFAQNVVPPPETPIEVAWWWPALVGLAFVIVPPTVLRIAGTRLGRLLPFLQLPGRTHAASVAVSMGVSAYVAVPLLLWDSSVEHWLLNLGAWTVGAALVAYLFGRVLDGAAPKALVPLPMVLAVALGFGLSRGDPAWLAVIAAGAAAVAWWPDLRAWLRRRQIRERVLERASQPVRDLADLVRLTDAPPFQPTLRFDDALQRAAPVSEGRTAWLVLSGPAGAGKSATASALAAKLKREASERGGQATAMVGECPVPEEGGTSPAYAPFQQALARHFDVNLLAPPEERSAQLRRGMEGMFEAVVPFAGLLLPPDGGAQNAPSTKREVFQSVVTLLKRLAKSRAQPVVLFVDDVHWMDDASCELLGHIREALPPDGEVPVLVLLTTREPSPPPQLDLDDHVQQLPVPDVPYMTNLLRGCTGLPEEEAEKIAENAVLDIENEGGLFRLFQLVRHLTEQDALEIVDGRVRLVPRYRGTTALPMPDSFLKAIQQQLKQHPDYRMILECAACLGREFRASVLAPSIEMPRLRTLTLLGDIEEETGFVYDVAEQDDVFAFRSTFLLETIRQSLRVSGRGPRAEGVPQLIREFHARAAHTLEQTLGRSTAMLHEVARHYYAAGMGHTEEAVRYGLEATRAARRNLAFAEAREHLHRVEECAVAGGHDVDLERERLLLDCDEAHVEGRGADGVARRGLELLEARGDVDFVIRSAVARACYDAGAGARDQEMFAHAVAVAEDIVSNAESDYERVVGHHFAGISLPPDRRQERTARLRQAHERAERLPHEEHRCRALLAQVANSLAEQLSYGGDTERAEAKELFEQSIAIKSEPELYDAPGLARSHGGLGRLAYFGEPKDTETAREHFERDLELSERVGDVTGQAMMHSLLGGCALAEGHGEQARTCYRRSLELAEREIDRWFAIVGVLDAAVACDDPTDVDELEGELADRDLESVPGPCRDPLERALSECAQRWSRPWLERGAAAEAESRSA